MTYWVVNKMIDKFNICADKTRIKILTSSTTNVLGGTSAQLLEHDNITISELLYGMMLPSGNDAAQTLGVYFGNV